MKKTKKTILITIKVLSSLCFAFVLTLVAQDFINFGLFSFIFLLLSLGSAFFYLIKNYQFLGVFLVDISLILLAFLLRFYVVFAYGS